MSRTSTPPATSRRARIAALLGIDDEWERPRPPIGRADVILVLCAGGMGLFDLELKRSLGAFEDTDIAVWAQWLAVISGSALLLGRRRWPLIVAGLAAAHMFAAGVYAPAIMAQPALQIAYFLAVMSGVAWARDRRMMVVVIGGIVLFMFAWLAWQLALGSTYQELLDEVGEADEAAEGVFAPMTALVGVTLLINGLYFGGAVVFGVMLWRGARQRAALEVQAATIASQAGRLRDQAVMEERMRIARELHDVVAHHVSAMGVQAGAARRVLTRDPASAEAALCNVEAASREAVTQMRGLLGALRDPGDPPTAVAGSREGEPTIADLEALVAHDSEPGLDVRFDLVEQPAGATARLPDPLGLSIYRTVQEALTNVRRHSTATRVSVVVRVDEAARTPYAEVEVVDDGRPRVGSSGSGLGQLGIRERAATHRAEVEIGPRVTGGYRVRVRYPLGEPR